MVQDFAGEVERQGRGVHLDRLRDVGPVVAKIAAGARDPLWLEDCRQYLERLPAGGVIPALVHAVNGYALGIN